MNERAAEVTDETEEPENQENNKDSPQHKFSFGWFTFLRTRSRGCAYRFFDWPYFGRPVGFYVAELNAGGAVSKTIQPRSQPFLFSEAHFP
jgi:hypothetical protein